MNWHFLYSGNRIKKFKYYKCYKINSDTTLYAEIPLSFINGNNEIGDIGMDEFNVF